MYFIGCPFNRTGGRLTEKDRQECLSYSAFSAWAMLTAKPPRRETRWKWTLRSYC